MQRHNHSFRILLIALLTTSHGASGFVTLPNNGRALPPMFSDIQAQQQGDSISDQRLGAKDALLSAIASTPSNSPTSRTKTTEIMQLARELESQCPTPEPKVLESLQGSWELLWTAQDRSQKDPSQLSPFREFINPLENQSYSNNPNGGSGRANPFLPQSVQQKLEDLGIVAQDSSSSSDPVRSSQNIDLKRQKVRNVVSFSVPFLGRKDETPAKSPKASLTVTVDFKPNLEDQRKIDVKFQECRVVLPNTPIDLVIPLGIIGPTGWLRTGYIDESIRITRGHKRSVFVLARPKSQTKER